MTRRSLLLIAALMLLPLGASAQEVAPGPTPNPHIYDDNGMHFVAPAEFHPIAQRKLKLEDLSDGLQVVAGWVGGSPSRPERIVLQQQAFDGSLDGFSSNFQQQLRQAYGDATFKNKEQTKLRNGMPAIFIQMTAGSGFDVTTVFTYLWVDGSRGVALSVMAPVGEVDADGAKRLLSDASAVRYPAERG
jgi:hypothetical protein